MGDEVTSTGTPSVSVDAQTKSETDDREPLPDAILRTIREAGQPLTNIEIRRTLERGPVHAKRFESSPNYFYTAMKRLRDRDFLIKVGDKFDLSPEEKGTPPNSSGGVPNTDGVEAPSNESQEDRHDLLG